MNRTIPCILTAALGLSLASTMSLAQAGGAGGPGGPIYANGLLVEPIGGAPASAGSDGRSAIFFCFDNSLTQGVQVPCDTDGGAQCTVDMTPVLSTPGARLRVWQLMQGQNASSALSHVTVTSTAGGSAECVADFSSLGATSVTVVVRDRYGNALATQTCSANACACTIADNGFDPAGGGGGGGGWVFSSTNKTGYNVKANVKCRLLSGQGTVTGVGPVAIAHAASVEFSPIICITEPCPTGWPHMSALRITAGNGGAPVALPISISNPALASFSWGVSNPTFTSGGPGAGRTACWGSGGATITEECPAAAGCTTGERVLRARGLDGPGPRSASVDFDPDELTIDQVHIRESPTKATRVAFSVTPGAFSPGTTGGTIECAVSGRESPTRPTVKRWVVRSAVSAAAMTSVSAATGERLPGVTGSCTVRLLSATGAVLGTGATVDFQSIACSSAVPAPVITIDPTDTCVVECSPAGTATCTLPGRPPVGGVARIEFRPSSPVVGVGCATLSVSGTNVSDAAVRVVDCVNPLYNGGIPVLAKSASLTVTGAPGGTTTATLSNIAPLSPTGEPVSGVSLVYGTKNAVSCDVDLDSCLTTAGSKLRIRNKGWDGLIYGNHRVTGAGGGHGDVLCDFSAQGAVSVHYVVRDNIGTVLAQGDVAGAQVACAIDTTCCGGPPPPGGSPNWSMACSADDWNLATNKGGRVAPFTVTGLGSSPITGASSLSFTRIVCITAPCPGDGTTALASMDLGFGGVSSMKVSECKMSLRAAAGTSPPVATGPRVSTAAPFGQVQAFPVCTYVAPCDASGEGICLMNIGSSGQDGVTFTPSQAAAEVFCSAKLDCLSVPAPENGPSSSTSFLTARRVGLPGHVTVLKIAVVPDPATGVALVSFDASGRLASQCLVECLSSAGAVLASAAANNGAAVTCVGAVSGGHLSYVGTCDASGRGTVSPFASTGQCILPDGTAVSGVAKLRCTPVSPGAPAGALDSVTKEVRCVRNEDTAVTFSFDVRAGGVAISPVGGAVLTPTTDGVDISNLSCTGNDGARVRFDTGNGGQVVLPVGDLFAGARPCGGPRIRIKHLAWDGSVSATTTLFRVDSGGAMTETFDASGTAAVAVEVVLTSASGAELARVTVPGAVATWLDTAEGNSATLNKAYSAVARSANEGFFDIAAKRSVTVSGLTAAPVPGVHAIRCTAIYPPGVAVASQLAALEVTGHSVTQIGVRSPERLRAAAGSNYPPPDRFLGALGTGAAVVSERCASIYPCPWDTQELVVSNIGSSGQDGVRLRAHFENGDIPSQTDFAVSGCGSWGETGGPPIIGSMSVSFGTGKNYVGHVTLIKQRLVPHPTAAGYAEDLYCDSSGFGSPSTIVRVLSASGSVLQTAVIGPSTPISVGYCNTQQMPTFGNHGNECFLQLPGVGNACYTITLPGSPPVSASKVTFNPFSITRIVEPINEVMFTGTSLSDIVISSAHMEFPPGCPADLGVQGGTPGQDGLLNNNDFVVFIDFFFTGDLRADLGVQGGGPGHDGLLNNNDFVAFINLFFGGCP